MLSTLTSPAHAGGAQFDRHPASERGFFANAYLIEGPRSCALIDAHLNMSEAEDLARLTHATGKPLSHIVITHPHPDHYLGLQFLGPRFPQAVVASAARSLPFIRAAAQDWPGFANPVQALKTGPLTLAETTFQCRVLPDAESVAPLVLFDPATGVLVAGDHVLHQQHLWLVEGRGRAWQRNLEQLRALSPKQILPGHGAVGGPELITQTDAYLKAFLHLSDMGLSASDRLTQMLARYPDYVFPLALQSSISAG